MGENVRLVGFTDTKIYGVRNETDKGNGVTDTVYLAFNRKNPEEAIELYRGNFSYILLEEVLEDTLYVMNAQMTENMDNPWLITLYMLGQNGKEEIVYSTRTLTIPQVWHNSTSFFVCAESKDSSLVSYIDVIIRQKRRIVYPPLFTMVFKEIRRVESRENLSCMEGEMTIIFIIRIK